MRACDADPDGQVADPERAEPVPAVRLQRAVALDRLGYDALAFTQRKFLEGLVLESRNRPAGVVITNPALE